MTNRRRFLAAAPASLLGFPYFAGTAFAQPNADNSGYDNDIASFWATSMAVPADQLGGTVVINRDANAPPATFEREPFLFYYDAKAHELVPATDVKPTLKSGDAQVSMTVSRYRLNKDDQATFGRYESGGMYLDVQQQQSTSQEIMSLASSMFTAIFPQGIGKGGSKNTKSSSSTSSSKSSSTTSTSTTPPASTTPASALATPSIQQASQTQTLALPNGVGKASVVVFAKDKKKTAFGMFISAISTATNMAQPAMMPLLSLPTIATPALAAVRALVANLQSHGGNQQWLLQGPPMDVAATADAASNLQNGAKFNSGYVVAVPKAHLSKMKSMMSNVQVVDGFLVPSSVKSIDVYDWIQANQPDGSYLTLATSVKSTKISNCSVSNLLKG